MNKSLNLAVIERLRVKYGVSKRYITMSIAGERKSETSEAIKKDYHQLVKKVTETLYQ